MRVRQYNNGWYAVSRSTKHKDKNVFLVKHSPVINCNSGRITIGALNFEPSFVGKRVRIKIELVEEVGSLNIQ